MSYTVLKDFCCRRILLEVTRCQCLNWLGISCNITDKSRDLSSITKYSWTFPCLNILKPKILQSSNLSEFQEDATRVKIYSRPYGMGCSQTIGMIDLLCKIPFWLHVSEVHKTLVNFILRRRSQPQAISSRTHKCLHLWDYLIRELFISHAPWVKGAPLLMHFSSMWL